MSSQDKPADETLRAYQRDRDAAIERAEKAEKELATWPQRASNLLDTVERPGSIPEGSPGSLHRRAWDLGRRPAATPRYEPYGEQSWDRLRERAETAESRLTVVEKELVEMRKVVEEKK